MQIRVKTRAVEKVFEFIDDELDRIYYRSKQTGPVGYHIVGFAKYFTLHTCKPGGKEKISKAYKNPFDPIYDNIVTQRYKRPFYCQFYNNGNDIYIALYKNKEMEDKDKVLVLEWDDLINLWVVTCPNVPKVKEVRFWLSTSMINFTNDLDALMSASNRLASLVLMIFADAQEIEIVSKGVLPCEDQVKKDKEKIAQMKEAERQRKIKEFQAKMKKRLDAVKEERKKHLKEIDYRERKQKFESLRAEINKLDFDKCSYDELKKFWTGIKRCRMDSNIFLNEDLWNLYTHLRAKDSSVVSDFIFIGINIYKANLRNYPDGYMKAIDDEAYNRDAIKSAFDEAVRKLYIAPSDELFNIFSERCNALKQLIKEKSKRKKVESFGEIPSYDFEYSDEELFGKEEDYHIHDSDEDEMDFDKEDLSLPYLKERKEFHYTDGEKEMMKEYKDMIYDAILVDSFD